MSRPPLRLRWNKRALRDLALIDKYAPGQAERVRDEMARQAAGGWSLGRPIRDGRQRWWPVSPWAVVYQARPGELVVIRVRQVRRLRGPLP